jgi:hypothetical protein
MIIRLLTVGSLAFALAAVPAEAAKPGKERKGGKGAGVGRMLNRFDRDHNGTINGEEVARVQAIFASFTALDTDKNGQLSESELASVKIPEGRRGGKKGATTTTPSTTSPSTTTTPKAQ